MNSTTSTEDFAQLRGKGSQHVASHKSSFHCGLLQPCLVTSPGNLTSELSSPVGQYESDFGQKKSASWRMSLTDGVTSFTTDLTMLTNELHSSNPKQRPLPT